MSELLKNIFPANLKMLRLEKGKTQDEMAHLIGITRGCLANYEAGKRLPDSETLKKIADKLDVTVEFLTYGRAPRRITLNEEELEIYTRANENLKEYGDILNLNEVNVVSRIVITNFFNFLKENEEKEKAAGNTSANK